jgi:trimethylamine--corrinoid protein Co-methyltransferase
MEYVTMAILKTKFLNKSEEDLIHASSIKTLETIGVMVRSQSTLKMLGDAGANVDLKTRIARIPEAMVNESIKKAPKEFKLHSRDGKHDLELPTPEFPFLATTGLAVYIRDIKTGKNRPSTKKDIADIVKVGDALNPIDFLWTTLTATEVPTISHGLHELWTAFQNTSKHVQGVSIGSADECKDQVKLASLITDGEDNLRKRPIFSVIACPVAPLSFEGGSVEGQVVLAKAGIPVVSMSMSLGGLSSPVTIGGIICNANTENLASLVITQAASPGAPHIYCVESMPIDMMTGGIAYGCPEVPSINAGCTQLAKRYGLPCFNGSWGSEMMVPIDFHDMSATAIGTMGGTDLLSGAGCTDDAMGAALEQVVSDAFSWEEFRSLQRKFTIDEESIALDIVKEVGHGNSFLSHPHTMKNFRKELHIEKQTTICGKTMPFESLKDAKNIAQRILTDHEVIEIDGGIVKRGDGIIKEFEKRHVE